MLSMFTVTINGETYISREIHKLYIKLTYVIYTPPFDTKSPFVDLGSKT